ncbi:MAG TPA: YqgE/AlgH family protein [Acidimicrobiales bacterium]|nr:YqgE/AlgH family protein [Acidimicrobiales bacterium]
MVEDSLKGRLLVALPPLVDANFNRTVVLVLAHAGYGALGVVLNRPGMTPTTEVFPHLDLITGPEVIFSGGPVEPDGIICLAAGTVAPGTSGYSAVLDEIGSLDPRRSVPDGLHAVRVFRGYAQWGAGQLEGELDEGAWLSFPATVNDAFTREPDGLWPAVLRRQGSRYARLANYPRDPSLN